MVARKIWGSLSKKQHDKGLLLLVSTSNHLHMPFINCGPGFHPKYSIQDFPCELETISNNYWWGKLQPTLVIDFVFSHVSFVNIPITKDETHKTFRRI